MRFTWNEGKRLGNRRIHGLDFRDVHNVFAGPTLTIEDARFVYYEQRFLTLGWLAELAVAVVHTETEEETHVISFRKATRRETARLFATLLQ